MWSTALNVPQANCCEPRKRLSLFVWSQTDNMVLPCPAGRQDPERVAQNTQSHFLRRIICSSSGRQKNIPIFCFHLSHRKFQYLIFLHCHQKSLEILFLHNGDSAFQSVNCKPVSTKH